MSNGVVHLLLNNQRRISSVWSDLSAAERKRDAYNADPFVSPGEHDPDAPYSVETWQVGHRAPPVVCPHGFIELSACQECGT